MYPFLDALRSALGFFQEYGIWAAIPVFLLVLAFSLGKIHLDQHPSAPKLEREPLRLEKKLTPEEDKNQGLKSLGCLILFLIIAGIVVIYMI